MSASVVKFTAPARPEFARGELVVHLYVISCDVRDCRETFVSVSRSASQKDACHDATGAGWDAPWAGPHRCDIHTKARVH